MKNHVNKTGIELEGYWYNKPENFKHDGSVEFQSDECNGECRDECYCFEECECLMCQACHGCEYNPNECECDDCLTCDDCDNILDECECVIESICKLKSCTNNNPCDDCMNSFYDNQTMGRDCERGHGMFNNCERDCGCECECQCDCSSGGELSSKPLNVNEIKQFIIDNYPDELNSTCGFHIHKSFTNDKRDINVLCTPEFHEHFNKSLRTWAINRKINKDSRFFKRLDGIYYCNNEFKGYAQLNQTDSNRYTQINFCSVSKFGTVEFRVGNMFDNPQITVEYTNELHRIVNQYLSTHEPRNYEYNIQINKTMSIYLKVNMVKSGLRIFLKTHGIEDYMKSKTYASFNKYRLYQNDSLLDELKTNLTTLFDSEHIVNLTFLRLKNQTNGKSMIIKGAFSNQDIERYMNNIIMELPRIIQLIKGEKLICA